jgi:hypothetical protein
MFVTRMDDRRAVVDAAKKRLRFRAVDPLVLGVASDKTADSLCEAPRATYEVTCPYVFRQVVSGVLVS